MRNADDIAGSAALSQGRNPGPVVVDVSRDVNSAVYNAVSFRYPDSFGKRGLAAAAF